MPLAQMSGTQLARMGLSSYGNVLGVIQGLQTGGISGYGQAGINMGSLAIKGLSATGEIAPGVASEASSVLGYAAIPLSVYNFAKNWQSGNTWGDVMQGAETGAAIGSAIPGVGTLIGAGVGAAIGGISSAFGPGKISQEAGFTRSVDTSLAGATVAQRAQAMSTMSPAQSTQYIQGMMNAHDQSPGHAEPIQLVWGKNNASGFISDMTKQVNTAMASNPAIKSMTPQQIFQNVVYPWMSAKGATINPNQRGVTGNPEGQDLIDAITNVIGEWQGGSLTSQTPVGVAGQTIPGLVPWGVNPSVYASAGMAPVTAGPRQTAAVSRF
jgi:hypothetical protein